MQIQLRNHINPLVVKTSSLELTIPMSFKLLHFVMKSCGEYIFKSCTLEYCYKELRKNYPMGEFDIYHIFEDDKLSFDICKH